MKNIKKLIITVLDHLPEEALFNISGVRRFQLTMNVMAMLPGGNVRVGLEDNV